MRFSFLSSSLRNTFNKQRKSANLKFLLIASAPFILHYRFGIYKNIMLRNLNTPFVPKWLFFLVNFIIQVLFQLNFITPVCIVLWFFRPPEHVPLSQWAVGWTRCFLSPSKRPQKDPSPLWLYSDSVSGVFLSLCWYINYSGSGAQAKHGCFVRRTVILFEQLWQIKQEVGLEISHLLLSMFLSRSLCSRCAKHKWIWGFEEIVLGFSALD